MKFTHKGIILVVVPLAFELLFVGFLAYLFNQVELEAQKLTQSKAVIATAGECRQKIIQLCMSLFASYMSRSPSSFARVDTFVDESEQLVQELGRLVANDPEESKVFVLIKDDWSNRIKPMVKKTKEGVKENEAVSKMFDVLELRRSSEKLAFESSRYVDRIISLEKKKGITSAKESQLREQTKQILAVGTLLNVIIAVILVIYFNHDAARRLRVLLDNAMRLSRQEPLLPRVRGTDEIAHLDSVFHKMAAELDRLSRSERAILENAVDVICTLDKDLKFTRINPACQKAWHHAPSDLMGQRLINVVHPDDVETTKSFFEQARDVSSSHQIENRIKSATGAYIYMLWSVQWSDLEKSFFCVAHDINDRREIERLKQEFVEMITHDLRTPLTSIQVTLGLIAQGSYGELNEKGTVRVSKAESSCDRLIDLINDLLDIEKMQSGKFELEIAETPVQTIVDRSLDSVRGFAERQGIKLEGTSCGATAFADERRLVQVLVNLLSNAIKFSHEGSSVELDVKVEQDDLSLAVIDHGRGIPKDHLDSIFDRFSQVRATDASEKGGTGLGLAICHSIVQAHEGTIGVESEEGKGSKFWIKIPLKKESHVKSGSSISGSSTS